MTSAAICLSCGATLDRDRDDRWLLPRGRRHDEHCSESCVRATLDLRRAARARAFWRVAGALALGGSLLGGGQALWQRFHVPSPASISFDAPEIHPAPAPSEPILYGPSWPPTDDEWMALFRQPGWVYPLPGPVRRAPIGSERMLGPAERPVCRTAGHCATDLGGELWGEHVYAVQDGVVDRLRRDGGIEAGGASVRLAHFGGLVFTQYFHLAGIPRGLYRGARVQAGDVIGLLGDTGTDGGGRRRLGFALSARPAPDWPETYWDPQPWMIGWPLQQPAHGTVAGFTP